ncbi:MAG: LacI family transcriptional regulator [Bacteroidales bacterium]|jgi:LacI family transcriptional regulator|nr:LacI family transcriptional regulator [Bacteroidales bacterium]
MTPKKARIKDIALLAGVSIGTVDRVLHKRGEVAKKTREKVTKIARDLDYSPNFIAQALKTRKKINLVSLLPEPTDESAFWKKHPQGIQKAMNELDPFPVMLNQITFDLTDEIDFQNKTSKVLSVHPDGVLLAPIFTSESITFCNSLTKKNIPFVFVDGYLRETQFLSYTGEDIFQSGRVAGQLTDMVTPEKKDILIINIARNLQNVHHLNKRIEGFLSFFPESGRTCRKKINLSISDPVREKIRKAIYKVLNKNPDIATIFISGSKSYKIADFIATEGIRSINIVGYDIHEQNVGYLKSGIIKFLIGQRPEEQTYKGVKKLFDYLSLNKVPEKIEYLPVDVVTSENVNFFL